MKKQYPPITLPDVGPLIDLVCEECGRPIRVKIGSHRKWCLGACAMAVKKQKAINKDNELNEKRREEKI